MHVLIVEDDDNIRQGLEKVFRGEGYEVTSSPDGAAGLAAFRASSPDIVCLDVMMPEMSGYDVCREIRKDSAQVPVIFISAKSEEIDKVLGLELGADDYIVKPFGVREVVARIRAVTRRCLQAEAAESVPEAFTMGDLVIIPRELRARRGETTVDLSLRELKILQLLYDKRGEVVDRHALFAHCWGVDHVPNSRTLDQHISQLRRKIESDPGNPEVVKTVYGVGYRFDG